MKQILLIGLGRFGRHMAMRLSELGHQIMAVDKDEDRVSAVTEYTTNVFVGDSTREDFLKSLGINNFDVCFVCIGDDFESSIVTTDLLKENGAKRVISRAASGIQEKILLRNGADSVIYPEHQVAEWSAVRYSSDYIADYFTLGDGYSIMEIGVPQSWRDRSLAELNLRNTAGINVLATKKNGELNVTVGPKTVLSENMTILVIGEDSRINRALDKADD